jgi:tetratricopeptide (TPR) repeat protein
VRARTILLAALVLAGCVSTPTPVDPPRLKAALEAESDGAKRYGRGDYAVAARRFGEALRLYASIDDASGTMRNRLHLARTELALGRAEAALAVLATAQGSDPGAALEILLLKAQGELALDRQAAAQQSLAAASGQCPAGCRQAASLHLLQARAALAAGRAADALAHAEVGLKLLQDRDEAAETGNAWRLIAAARLAAGDTGGALPAARSALEIDRRLAQPEKIARDWLLIGDIQKAAGSEEAAAAYRRALEVADAAGLSDITRTAKQALANPALHK